MPHDSYKQDPGQGELDFDAVVEEFYAPLFRFAMSLTRTEHEACDLVQQTFLIWAEKGSQLRDARKIKPWLFTTLHREFLRIKRRVLRFPEVEIEGMEADLPFVDPEQAGRLAGAEVLELVTKLDPEQRAVVALFYLEDYAYGEIAEILDLPLGTVKSRLSRGVAQLKRLVADSERVPRAGKEEG